MNIISKLLPSFAAGVFLLSATQAFSSPGLVALYKFNETNPSQPAADSSGHGLNGIYEGGVNWEASTFSFDTNQVDFDGASAFVAIPGDGWGPFTTNSQDLTIEFWMNFNPIDTGGQAPLSCGANNTPWTTYIPGLSSYTAPRQFAWIVGGSEIITPALVQPSTWTHVAVVQGLTNAIIYLNGQEAVAGTMSLIPQPRLGGIILGKRGDGVNFNGSLANVAIYNSVLTANQMQSDMTSVPTPGTSNLVALWECNQTSIASPMVDSSGNGNNGAYEPGVTLGLPGPLTSGTATNAVYFNGAANSYAVVPINPLFSSPTLSIEFWINVPGSNYASSMIFMDCGQNNTGDNGNLPWDIFLPAVSGATNTTPRDLEFINPYGNTASGALTPDAWHFVVLTQTGITLNMYVDGNNIFTGENPGVGNLTHFIGDRPSVSSSGTPLMISIPFDGSMDDVAIYNLALSQSQIQHDMSNGVSVGPITPQVFLIAAPQNAIVQPGLTTSFTIVPYITGGNLSQFGYQWQKNGTNITGATNATYLTPAETLADNGAQITCTVTYPGSPNFTSPAATLTVRLPNLLGLWKFDETSASSPAADSSSNANNGTYEGNCQLVPGVFGNALAVDGVASDFVDIPSITNYDVQNQTISFWMYASNSYSLGEIPIARTVAASANNYPWDIYLQPGAPGRPESVISYIIANGSESSTPDTVTAGVWHHVAITQQGATAAVYVDGLLESYAPATALPAPGWVFSTYTTADLFVGNRSGAVLPYSGLIDDLAWFDMALTQNQIVAQMQHGASSNVVTALPTFAIVPLSLAVQPGQAATFSLVNATGGIPSSFGYQWQKNGTNIAAATNSSYTTPPAAPGDNGATFDCFVTFPGSPGLTTSNATLQVTVPSQLGLWKFDETDPSQPVADSSGNGNAGSYVGNCQLAPGVFGNAVYLDGNLSDYVDIPSTTNWDVQSMTVAFWINIVGSNTAGQIPISRCTYAQNFPWDLYLPAASAGAPRQLEWIIAGSALATAAIATPDVWHHVAIAQQFNVGNGYIDTRPATDQSPFPAAAEINCAIYLDGNLAAQGALANLPGPGWAVVNVTTADLLVGRRSDALPFQGAIDDLALYNYALTQDQIINVMQHGAAASLVAASKEVQPVSLAVQKIGATLQISWTAPGFTLQQNSNLANHAGWTSVSGDNGSPVSVNLSTNTTFYRLIQTAGVPVP